MKLNVWIFFALTVLYSIASLVLFIASSLGAGMGPGITIAVGAVIFFILFNLVVFVFTLIYSLRGTSIITLSARALILVIAIQALVITFSLGACTNGGSGVSFFIERILGTGNSCHTSPYFAYAFLGYIFYMIMAFTFLLTIKTVQKPHKIVRLSRNNSLHVFPEILSSTLIAGYFIAGTILIISEWMRRPHQDYLTILYFLILGPVNTPPHTIRTLIISGIGTTLIYYINTKTNIKTTVISAFIIFLLVLLLSLVWVVHIDHNCAFTSCYENYR